MNTAEFVIVCALWSSIVLAFGYLIWPTLRDLRIFQRLRK